jgi:hypothetical protein
MSSTNMLKRNKTTSMIISNNKNRSCIDRHYFYFGPNQLESCTEYKYVGVIFNNKVIPVLQPMQKNK